MRCGCCSSIWEDGGPRDRGPAVAIWGAPVSVPLCQSCLDCWFDNADDDPDLEPASWSWLPGHHPAEVLAHA